MSTNRGTPPLHGREDVNVHQIEAAAGVHRTGIRVLLAAAVVGAVGSYRYTYRREADLQDGVAAALASSGLPARREVALSGRDRPDLLVGGVAVEVKVAGSPSTVLAQLLRYAEHDQVRELVLVTTRVQHRTLPATVGGKPLTVLHLGGAA